MRSRKRETRRRPQVRQDQCSRGGAADYYRELSESARAEWERKYIEELVRLSQPARLVTPYVRRPQ